MPIVRYETITVRGIITGKRVENGEHLADLDVWFDKEDGEGNVHEKLLSVAPLLYFKVQAKRIC